MSEKDINTPEALRRGYIFKIYIGCVLFLTICNRYLYVQYVHNLFTLFHMLNIYIATHLSEIKINSSFYESLKHLNFTVIREAIAGFKWSHFKSCSYENIFLPRGKQKLGSKSGPQVPLEIKVKRTICLKKYSMLVNPCRNSQVYIIKYKSHGSMNSSKNLFNL